MTDKELIEQLADKEHESWARWMDYLFSKCEPLPDGSLVIPFPYVMRWRRQTETPYSGLSDNEQQSDRNEVAHILPTIREYNRTFITLKPAKMKNLQITEWCPLCHKAKGYSGMLVMGETNDEDAQEVPEQCRCALFQQASAPTHLTGSFFGHPWGEPNDG